MTSSNKIVVSISILAGLAMGKPIIKTGDCPTVGRYNAPDTEEWSQFPIKPNPLTAYPINTIQNPMTPAQSANCIETPPGLHAELWASEGAVSGDISYLQHFTFDERGRMWAVEPRSYPNIIRPATNSITDQKFVGGMVYS